MSDGAQIQLNLPQQDIPPAQAAALPSAVDSLRLTGKASELSEDRPKENSIVLSLAAFRPHYRQLLRAGMAIMLIVLTVEWVVIATRRPDPLPLERGGDFKSQFQVDINSASWVEWLQLDGIGPATAHRIVADRKLNGPFASIDDLKRVPGIGPVTLESIRRWLTMGHDINDSRTADAGNRGPSKLTP